MDTILLTGATGDIGREVIRQALAAGLRVFATIRKAEDAEKFTRHQQLHFLTMSVDERLSVVKAFAELDRLLQGSRLKAVIHAAAISQSRTIEFVEPETVESTLRINTFGTVYVLQESIKRLRGSGGHFIFAGSMLGRVALPLVGIYAASKHAVEAVIATARLECRGQDLNLVIARIGAVRSRMLDAHTNAVTKGQHYLPPEILRLYSGMYGHNAVNAEKFGAMASNVPDVANALLRIVHQSRPKAYYSIGKDTRLMLFLDWLLPVSWLDRLIGGR